MNHQCDGKVKGQGLTPLKISHFYKGRFCIWHNDCLWCVDYNNNGFRSPISIWIKGTGKKNVNSDLRIVMRTKFDGSVQIRQDNCLWRVDNNKAFILPI